MRENVWNDCFAFRSEIPIFFSDYVKSDTVTLEKQLRDCGFLKERAFLTDITGQLDDLKTNLQGKDQTVPSLFGNVNGFRNKQPFSNMFGESDLSHFPSCKDRQKNCEILVAQSFYLLLLKLKVYSQNSVCVFRILKL